MSLLRFSSSFLLLSSSLPLSSSLSCSPRLSSSLSSSRRSSSLLLSPHSPHSPLCLSFSHPPSSSSLSSILLRPRFFSSSLLQRDQEREEQEEEEGQSGWRDSWLVWAGTGAGLYGVLEGLEIDVLQDILMQGVEVIEGLLDKIWPQRHEPWDLRFLDKKFGNIAAVVFVTQWLKAILQKFPK
uniref:Uncharacterized protein n=1 Tax=Paramoeba aestuarina TaxID=180227 RepID=A0A7S4P8Z2_9EUKA